MTGWGESLSRAPGQARAAAKVADLAVAFRMLGGRCPRDVLALDRPRSNRGRTRPRCEAPAGRASAIGPRTGGPAPEPEQGGGRSGSAPTRLRPDDGSGRRRHLRRVHWPRITTRSTSRSRPAARIQSPWASPPPYATPPRSTMANGRVPLAPLRPFRRRLAGGPAVVIGGTTGIGSQRFERFSATAPE